MGRTAFKDASPPSSQYVDDFPGASIFRRRRHPPHHPHHKMPDVFFVCCLWCLAHACLWWLAPAWIVRRRRRLCVCVCMCETSHHHPQHVCVCVCVFLGHVFPTHLSLIHGFFWRGAGGWALGRGAGHSGRAGARPRAQMRSARKTTCKVHSRGTTHTGTLERPPVTPPALLLQCAHFLTLNSRPLWPCSSPIS